MMGSHQAPKGNGNIIVPVEKDGVRFVSMGLMNPSGKALIIRAPLAIKAVQQFLTGVQWGELDYLFIDLPPGTGDIQLTLAQQAKLSGAVIVTTPQKVASDVAQGHEMFETVNVPVVGIVENMSGYKCPKCDEVTPVFGRRRRRNLRISLMFLFFLVFQWTQSFWLTQIQAKQPMEIIETHFIRKNL